MQLTKNKKIFLALGIVLLFIVSCLLIIQVAGAQDDFWSASKHLTNIGQRVNLAGENVDVPTAIGRIINGVLVFLGVLCMGFIIYAGLHLMTAGGNEEVVQEARATIKWAIIGVIVVLGAYALSNYVVSRVIESQSPPTRPIMPAEELLDDCILANCTAETTPEGCLGIKDFGGQVCCTWYSGWRNPRTGQQTGACFSLNSAP